MRGIETFEGQHDDQLVQMSRIRQMRQLNSPSKIGIGTMPYKRPILSTEKMPGASRKLHCMCDSKRGLTAKPPKNTAFPEVCHVRIQECRLCGGRTPWQRVCKRVRFQLRSEPLGLHMIETIPLLSCRYSRHLARKPEGVRPSGSMYTVLTMTNMKSAPLMVCFSTATEGSGKRCSFR
ncbi:hypothetical protein PMIN07_010987 [Paraphaeosphaeria minitans]